MLISWRTVALLAPLLALSHYAAFRAGGTQRSAVPPQVMERAPSTAPTFTALAAPHAAVADCSKLQAQLEETKANNDWLTTRLDENNGLWRSILLAGAEPDSDDAKDETETPDTAETPADQRKERPAMCVARCELVQKAASCAS